MENTHKKKKYTKKYTKIYKKLYKKLVHLERAVIDNVN